MRPASKCGTWPGYGAQKNYAAALASHDWILSLDADERVTPALAEEIQALLRGGPAASGYRIPASRTISGAGSAAPTGIPTISSASTTAAPARWSEHTVHESIELPGARRDGCAASC